MTTSPDPTPSDINDSIAVLGEIAHDLRAPLANLQGFGRELDTACDELRILFAEPTTPTDLQSRGLDVLNANIHPTLQALHRAAGRMQQLLDALLKLSRIGRLEYAWEWVDLHAMVTKLLETHGSVIRQHNVTVSLGDLAPAWGDAVALEQLFANLIDNSLHYRDPQRPCHLVIDMTTAPEPTAPQTTAAEPTTTPAAVRTYFIRDNGLGIPPAMHDRVFQPFVRCHAAHAPGEGLGLAIVQRIAQRHQGTAWLKSKEGQGTTVFIQLPTR